MENLNRIKGALADAGKTGVWLASQLGKPEFKQTMQQCRIHC